METRIFEPDPAFAAHLDREDDLAPFREAFLRPEPGLIYLDGNSLGPLPRAAMKRMPEILEREWGRDLIRGWNSGWYEAPSRVGGKIARLVGAGPEEVLVCDSTSVNLFKLVMAALTMRPERRRIVSDVLNFPSDLYILRGCAELLGRGHRIDLAPSRDGIGVEPEDLLDLIDEDTALVTLSLVTFKSGFLYDAAAVTEKARHMGAPVLWDLSHAVGAVPVELEEWGADLAVGCTYKYLNGGPGSPAFLYVRREIQEAARSPLQGWFGRKSPFDFDLVYHPAEGVARFAAGTPPVLSLLVMESALDPVLEAGMERIRRKSIMLTSYLVYLVERILGPLGFSLGSPRDPARRGSHVSIRHPEAFRINLALIREMDVLPDFREPDNIRLGLSPLYNNFTEVREAVGRIGRVMEDGLYRRYSPEREGVT